MASEPDDKTLLEFVARFLCWTYVREYTGYDFHEPRFLIGVWKRGTERTRALPDYLGDLNIWHREVWPKIQPLGLRAKWYDKFQYDFHWDAANADARQRCLALFRALDGKLPGETT